jgi:hypothetical protein
MKRALSGLLGALLLGGTLLASVAAPKPAQADFFHRRRVENRRVWNRGTYNRRHDWDRDGIRNRRDRDDDNDGVPDWRDRNDRSRRSHRYYYNGRYYNGWGYYNRQDRDGDGYRNSRDDHPDDPRRH